MKKLIRMILLGGLLLVFHRAQADNPGNPCTYNYPPPWFCEGQDCDKKISAVSPEGPNENNKIVVSSSDIETIASNICMFVFESGSENLDANCAAIQNCIEDRADSLTGSFHEACSKISGKYHCDPVVYSQKVCTSIHYAEDLSNNIHEQCKKKKIHGVEKSQGVTHLSQVVPGPADGDVPPAPDTPGDSGPTDSGPVGDVKGTPDTHGDSQVKQEALKEPATGGGGGCALQKDLP